MIKISQALPSMISLRLFLLVLVTLVCRELAGDNPPALLLSSGLAALGISLGFGLLLKASAVNVLRARARLEHGACANVHSELCWEFCVERFNQSRSRIESLWIVVLPAALLATGWGQSLNSLQLSGWPQSITLVGWFLPSLLMLVFVELTAAQFDQLRNDASAPGQTSNWRLEWLSRLRLGEMTSLLTCISPIVLIAVLTDLAGLAFVDRPSASVVFAMTFLALALAGLLTPVWLGRWMGVEPLPQGACRDRIYGLLHGLGIRGVAPRLLPSRGKWPGAAVVGWLPMFRQLWLGDALIERLNDRELDMVVMHELAHVTRRHFVWRVLPIFWALGVVVLVWLVWPINEQNEAIRTVATSIAASVILLLGLSHMAHACELDADLAACGLAEISCEWVKGNPRQAAIEMGNALRTLMHDCPNAAASTWLHPSLKRRLENLQQTKVAKKRADSVFAEL